MQKLNNILNNNVILFLSIVLAICFMNFHQMEGRMWTGPYLSAAHNFNFSNIYLSWNEIKKFSQLPYEDIYNYKFTDNNVTLSKNNAYYGFAFIIYIITKIFFFFGNLKAIVFAQASLHIIYSLVIINTLKENYEKLIFFILYAINPIVLYFVNFPFYYFWQSVVSFIFVYYYLTNKKIGKYIFIITLIFSIIYLTRPTVLFLILFFYILYGYRENWKNVIISLILFLGIINILPKSDKNAGIPWHTIFEGIGGYSNPYGIEIYDRYAYSYYTKKTGKVFQNYKVEDAPNYSDYINTLKQRYLEILKDNPILILRNAILNIIESYSFGYKYENKILIYISIFIGFTMMILLLYTKQYILFLAIGLAAGTFTPYFPPIAAYMYGSYLLIVIGFIRIIKYFIERKSNETITTRP